MLYLINGQEPERIQRDPSGRLVVHSIFKTIQGEGPYAGHAALFIRLKGCNLQCPGCDTDYTSKEKSAGPHEVLHIVRDWNDWLDGLIVITGGEPFRQNITPLVRLLLEHGYQVQIESNGVLYPGDDFPWDRATVVVSPKTGRIHPKTGVRANAYKYVLSHDNVAPDGLPRTALGHPLQGYPHVARPPQGWTGPVYLQPMDVRDTMENERNVQAVVASVVKHRRYIMGVQMHKLTGLP